ncbi:hypothetical protein EDD21DRAFT_401715 [Dissophora ornata]|nr:hypothetical protein BGZ58_000394 [Dissophora ornata]KAI8604860.1 hypothetical protein EDD21DRAFT_401715 [Dissophora ornata]
MAPSNRDYCCCCIPLRLAVAIVSILALALGGASLWNIHRTGVTGSKIPAYVATGIYCLLGVSGLFSVIFKRYALAKNFSVLWWTVTICVTILAVADLVLLGTSEKDDAKTVCQNNLLTENDKYTGVTYDPQALADDVDNCYKYVMIITGIALAVQVLIMSIGGCVASRYTSEVKHMKDGLIYTYGQGYGPLQAQPPMQTQVPVYQPAHPYTHMGGKQ